MMLAFDSADAYESSWYVLTEDSDREAIGNYVKSKIPYVSAWEPNYRAMAIMRQGMIAAGVIFHNYSPPSIDISMAAEPGSGWMTGPFCALVFGYVFEDLKCKRINCMTSARNVRCQRLLVDLGFKHEGTHPDYYIDDDMLSYGMLRKDCRYG